MGLSVLKSCLCEARKVWSRLGWGPRYIALHENVWLIDIYFFRGACGVNCSDEEMLRGKF